MTDHSGRLLLTATAKQKPTEGIYAWWYRACGPLVHRARMSISKLDVVPGAVGTNLIPFGSLEGEAHGYNNNFLANRLAAGVVRD